MKRFSALLAALLLLCALAVPALADIAYEPDDSFFRHHNCDYEHRRWFTSGAEGYVVVYKSPVGASAGVLPNGLGFWVNYTYDGEWGQIDYDADDPADADRHNCVSGWVKLADMVVDYDYRSFEADHASEFTESEERLEAERGSAVFCYKYPGSGIVSDKLKADWAESDAPWFSSIFTDSAGRRWGYVGYYCGHRNLWICLDDPGNPELPADENFHEVPTVAAAAGDVLAAAQKSAAGPNLYLYAGIGGVIVIAAAVLIAVLRKKK